MPFKASNILPQEAYQTVKRAAVQLKINLQSFNSVLAVSSADYDYIRGVYRTLERANSQFNNLKTTPGIGQFAKDQELDQTYDVVGAFGSMQTSIGAALSWIDLNVPTSVTAKSPSEWGDGTIIALSFTPTQTSGLQLVLASVIAEID